MSIKYISKHLTKSIILLTIFSIAQNKISAQENTGVSVNERQEIKQYISSFEIKPYNIFLSEDVNFSANFYKNAISKTTGGIFISSKNEPNSPHYLILNSHTIGFGGYSGVHLYNYSGGKISHIYSTGVYSTKENDIKPSLHNYSNLKHLGVDHHLIYHGTPHTINPVKNYHKNLHINFGQLPEALTNSVLKGTILGNRLVVQLNGQEAKEILKIMQSQTEIENVSSSLLANWDASIFYTDLNKTELVNYMITNKIAYNFISNVYSILNWPVPTMKGHNMAFPIILYAVSSPPTPVFNRVSKQENENFLRLNFNVTDIEFISSDNVFDLIQKTKATLKNGIKIEKRGEQNFYKYSNMVMRSSKFSEEKWRTEYNLEEYQGEVDSDLLPHGRGTLKLRDRSHLMIGNFEHGLPHGLIHIHNGENMLSAKHYINGVENGPYIYFDPYTSVKLSEGWIVNGQHYPQIEHFYEVNPQEVSIHKSAKRPQTLKFKKIFYYDQNQKEPTLVGNNIEHTPRLWKYPNGSEVAVNGNKAILKYPNGDMLSGDFKYLEYEYNLDRNTMARGYGTFSGTCTYYSKTKGYLLEGEYDNDKKDIKEGNIKITIHDDVRNKIVKKSGKYKNGEITFRKTTVFDVLFDEVFSFIKNGKVDFESIFFHSINVVGEWFETAMGTSIPPVSASESFSWEESYKSTAEIRGEELKKKGYEFKPTPYEDLKFIDRDYEFKYNDKIIRLNMRAPMEGIIHVRMETSGEGLPESSRDGGTREHSAYDLSTIPGREVLSPIDGVVVNHGFSGKGNLRTIWIETQAETGELIRVKILYATPDEFDEMRVSSISLSERQKGSGIQVKKGDIIGTAQSLEAYNVDPTKAPVSDHIHMEIHVMEEYMKWSDKNKVSTPPFPLPPSLVPRIEENKKNRIEELTPVND